MEERGYERKVIRQAVEEALHKAGTGEGLSKA
jgi:hypothetical protein